MHCKDFISSKCTFSVTWAQDTYPIINLKSYYKNISRINKKDIQISKELIDEHDIDFENISISEIDNIEDLLECNIHIFGCHKKFNNKKLLENL